MNVVGGGHGKSQLEHDLDTLGGVIGRLATAITKPQFIRFRNLAA